MLIKGGRAGHDRVREVTRCITQFVTLYLRSVVDIGGIEHKMQSILLWMARIWLIVVLLAQISVIKEKKGGTLESVVAGFEAFLLLGLFIYF